MGYGSLGTLFTTSLRVHITSDSEQFLAEMRRVFHHPGGGVGNDQRLLQLTQGACSVAEMAIEFCTLAAESGWNTQALQAAFHQALAPELKDELAFRDPAPNLDYLIDVAIRVDSVRDRRSKKQQDQVTAQSFPASFHRGTHAAWEKSLITIWTGQTYAGAVLSVLWWTGAFSNSFPWICGKRDFSSRERGAEVREITDPRSSAGYSTMMHFSWGSGWHKSSAFIDSGAVGNFMDNTLAKSWRIPLITLQDKLTITSLDNRPLGSGQVTHCTISISVEMDSYQESLSFLIIDTPEFPVILGYPWLVSHNPQIDWPTSHFTRWRCACPMAGIISSPESFGGLNDNSGTSMSQICQGLRY